MERAGLFATMKNPSQDKGTIVPGGGGGSAGWRRIPHGLEMGLEAVPGEVVQVTVLRAEVVRIRISKNGVWEENPSHAVLPERSLPEATPIEIREQPDRVELVTGAVTVSLYRDPFHVEIRRADGTPVLASPRDAQGRPWFYRVRGDGFEVGRRIGGRDGIHGLGEKTGPFNKNGRNWAFWNTDVLNPSVAGGYREIPHPDPSKDPTSTEFDPYYVSIPFFLHRRAENGEVAGFFLDNPGRSHLDFRRAEETVFHFESGPYTEYVFAGPRAPEILRGYTGLTGRMPLPPLWALGNHQCRWHDYRQDQVEALASRYRRERLPCDVLWIDIDYMNGFRVFTWDREKFPDPARLMENLAKEKFKLITIIDPGVKEEPGYPVYDDALRNRLVCLDAQGRPYVGQVWPGRTVFPDFTLPEARAWWGRLNAEHVRSGIAGIWNDMNEPATGDVPAEGMLFGNGRFPHARFHNEYALLMAMGTVEGLRAAMPDRRTFVLSRAGSPGIQRYAANWLGDNCSRWSHLGLAVRMALGMGLSGQPFVGADVGGFMEACSEELLVRWYQYAAWTPFCRNHNATGQPDQYPWSFGEAALGIIRRALQDRYRLMPYLYAQFVLASETGMPVQRPLGLEFPDLAAAWETEDEFFLGAHMLVAPVLEKGATQRSVYLPPGDWYRWQDGSRESSPGGQFSVPVTMDSIPVWVRGGAVIPCWAEPPLSTLGYQPEVISLHVYLPGKDGRTESFLYEDDGITDDPSGQSQLRTTLALTRQGDSVTLEGRVQGRPFPGFRRQAFRLILHTPAGEKWGWGADASRPAGGWDFPNRGESWQIAARRLG